MFDIWQGAGDRCLSAGEIRELHDGLPGDVLLLIDGAYMDYATPAIAPTTCALVVYAIPGASFLFFARNALNLSRPPASADRKNSEYTRVPVSLG